MKLLGQSQTDHPMSRPPFRQGKAGDGCSKGDPDNQIGLQVNLGREATTRAAEGLTTLPPFAPAAETCARTTVESNI